MLSWPNLAREQDSPRLSLSLSRQRRRLGTSEAPERAMAWVRDSQTFLSNSSFSDHDGQSLRFGLLCFLNW